MKLMALVAIALACGQTLWAASGSLQLNLGGQEIAAGTAFSIGNQLQAQFPSINLSQVTLQKIVVEAKSPDGLSSLQLEAHGNLSPVSPVGGSSTEYDAADAWTYYSVPLNNPDFSGTGDWTLHVNGRIRVSSIYLVGAGLTVANRVDLGTYRTAVNNQHFCIPVNLARVTSIVIAGDATESDITNVSATIENGQKIDLSNLNSPWLAAGQEVSQALPADANGVFVYSVDLDAQAWISNQSSVFKVYAVIAN